MPVLQGGLKAIVVLTSCLSLICVIFKEGCWLGSGSVVVHREGSESGGLACAPVASAPVSHPRSRALVPARLGVSIRAAAAEPALCPPRPRLLPGLPIYRPDRHVLGRNTMSPSSSLSLQTGSVPWQDGQLPPLALSLVLLPMTETVQQMQW